MERDDNAAVPATLLGLLGRYSPTGSEAPAVAWLVEHMRGLGFTPAEADAAGNAVAVMGTGPRQIVLLGHIDTVRGEIPLRVESGRLYGRGAVDAKGPLAAFVEAVAAVGPQPGWQMVVIGAVDEEGDSAGARHAAGQYAPEFAIIGEPSRWDTVTLGYKGSARAEVWARQAQAHSAGPGDSACEAAVGVWNSVQAWAASFNVGRERVFDQISPRLLSMDSGGDGFADWARLVVGARLPVGYAPDDWYGQLTALAGEAQVVPQGYAVPAYRAEKNSAPVRAFLAAIRAEGGRPGFVTKTGTADLNIVAPAWGCPAVAYGPGDSHLDHTSDEHIELAE
jgi:LysW-gamma-L-lysine carboxypeptidase